MNDGVRIRSVGPLPQVDVRFDPRDDDLVARIASAATVAPPRRPNTVSSAPDGLGHWLWLGPDEWLVVGPEGGADDIAPAVEAILRKAAGDAFLTTVDVSANRVALDVSGPGARDLLAFGCSLDLDPRRFPVGSCAQTMVARAGVILWLVDAVPTFRLLVRPSFVTYLQAWLDDAGVGLG